MTASNETLRVGIFDRFDRANTALDELIEAGVDRERLSIVSPNQGPSIPEGVERIDPKDGSKAASAAAGATVGSVIGGLTAAVGAALTGGAGILVAGALLQGGAAMGVAGGFVGAMMARGLEPDIADFYNRALEDGNVLVAVEASDVAGQPSLEEVGAILKRLGARSHEMPA